MSSLSVKKAPLNMKNKDHFTLGQLREAGDMLLDQGKLDDADEMFTKAFEHCKRKLGPDHPETLMVIFKHGLCLENKKRFIEAEEKLMFVYTGRLKVLGPIDVETNNAAFAIGELNRKLTRFHKAAEYYRIAYNGYLECKGKKDPVTAKTKVYLDEMINSQSSVCSLS